MLNINQPLRKYILSILRTYKDMLRDGRGVERDTGRLGRSLRMSQSKHEGLIYAEDYMTSLRSDRDFASKRKRSVATRNGFIKQGLKEADEKNLDKLLTGIAEELIKTI